MAVTIFRIARILDGKNQKQVAREARISLSVLSQVENGWLTPKPYQLKRLEKALPKLHMAKTLME